MNAFITGSRAYGLPREDSDIDLVLCVSRRDINILWGLSESTLGEGEFFVKKGGVRYGNLNLILFDKDDTEAVKRYEAWKEATKKLEEIGGCTRLQAISLITRLGGVKPEEEGTLSGERYV
jgi:hypothetical protein